MNTYRIRFSDQAILYFRARLDEVRRRGADDAFMDKAVDAWRERKIHTIVVFSEDHAPILRDQDRREFEFIFISPTASASGDYEALHRLNGEISVHLNRHSVLFLYDSANSPAVMNYAAMFYLQIKKDADIKPEWTVNRLAGRDGYEPSDRAIHEFKKFLNPSYQLPDFFNNGSPAPEDEPAPPEPSVSDAKQVDAQENPMDAESDSVPETVATDSPNQDPASTPPQEVEPPAAATPELAVAPAPAPAPELTVAPVVPATAAATAPASIAPRAPVPAITPEPTPPSTSSNDDDDGGVKPEKKFKLSKFTIRVKLLGIISAILVGSMSLMILIATINFSNSIQDRVESDNVKLISVIGDKTTSEFNNVLQNAGELASAKSGERFFRNNAQVIFGGLAVREGDGLRFTRKFYNPEFLKNGELTREKIDGLHDLNGPSFTKSFAGAIVVRNISPGFALPVLGLSRESPFRNGIIVLYLDANTFLSSFAKSGKDDDIQLFMVDAAGDVVAHPDEAKVRSRSNLSDLGIVAAMLKSQVKTGRKDYEDETGVSWLGNYKKLDFADVGIIATAKEEDVFKAVRHVQQINILILIIVVNVALIVIYFFARTIVRPIKRLVDATEQVDNKNFSVRMDPDRNDELGQLTQSFSDMTAGLEEGEKVKDVMARMSNKVIVELAAAGKLALGGQYKHAAVFFSDLRGFTAMSETMTPDEVVSFLNDYFTDMVRCVVDTNGVVDKFIGDAIMAHWGAIPSPGNVTENAVNAALLMRGALVRFNALNALDRPVAKMGCGINTGDVISGQIGSSERYEYTVIGDAVNLASRIEALNKPFGTDILISQDSYDLVKDIYVVEKMPAIKVKGKSEPQTIYAVVRRQDDPSGPQNMTEVRQLVGIDWDTGKQLGDVLEEDKEEKFEVLE